MSAELALVEALRAVALQRQRDAAMSLLDLTRRIVDLERARAATLETTLEEYRRHLIERTRERDEALQLAESRLERLRLYETKALTT